MSRAGMYGDIISYMTVSCQGVLPCTNVYAERKKLMKKISVIIPMYNAEAFITQCIRSVTEQTYQNWEAVVVDDGSLDQGAAICEKMSREDNRIRLYRQDNKGVSYARNKGLDLAEGEYVFFLDSDDAIHPRLFEEMIGQAETGRTELVFCGYTMWTPSLAEETETDSNEIRKTSSLSNHGRQGGDTLKWQTADGEEVQEWFHRTHINEMSGIGGKLIDRSAVGSLRFDVSLTNGEDTYFLYSLICQGIRAAYSSQGWYYYRRHQESVTHSVQMVRGQRYYESSRRIRDGEYRRGNITYALTWEILAAEQIEKNYMMQRRSRDREGMKRIRRIAAEERRHPMFGQLYLSNKILFDSCFSCYPLYWVLSHIVSILQNRSTIIPMTDLKEAFQLCFGRKGEISMKRREASVGILTFHCSNNYGAMLQAYGLKRFLQSRRIRTDIVRYEPVYMTGRHWWIPYSPIKGLRGRIWGILNMWTGFLAHLRMRKDFLRQRTNMNRFRFRYLVDKRRHKVLSEIGLRRLPYQYYVVGSDQIWNPDITCGLRRAYFGAFKNIRKKKVIAYAASFGGAALDPKYDEEFSKLIENVDAVSVREEAAVPYVKRLCGREVTAVLDPVFFLPKEAWQKVELTPKRERFIFLYITEKNEEMTEYAKKLSEDTRLPVVEVRATMVGADAEFEVDHGAGPSEFLGYIDKADYVVSNSFHAVAFSIIYQKQFLAFAHSSLGARVRNILKLHGLENRLYSKGEDTRIDAPADWDEVRRKTKEQTKLAKEFLIKNIV